MPTQLSGARFLSERKNALLADEPRCGKTGTAIMAADDVLARTILVVTTASGRSVWERAFSIWSHFPRTLQVMKRSSKLDRATDVAIVGWGDISHPELRVQLLARRWDVVISDEDHWAKSFDAARTKAFYGEMIEDGARVLISTSIVGKADRVWPLTGTPLPNSPLDAYPRLRVLAPERLMADGARGWPNVVKFSDFRDRYCVGHPMKIGRGSYARYQFVVKGGRNEEELQARIGDFMLLRTQRDVGLRPPVYETFPLIIPATAMKEARSTPEGREILAGMGDREAKALLKAAEENDEKKLELELGLKRRITGALKAHAVVEAIKEEFDGGLDKIVLAYWHRDVGKILLDGLKSYGVVGIDGSTPTDKRAAATAEFAKGARVFLGQIAAAGEAIDLSPASELLFVESSFVPAQMRQMSDRITNVNQARMTRVRVATLAGSVDDALQAILLRKWSSIRKVLSQ